MDSSPSKENALPSLPPSPTKADVLPALPPSTSGLKRPPPTLLPAFEPSSSPGFCRTSAKRFRAISSTRNDAFSKYPTPVPTSTTGILSSSPPRPGLQRRISSVSERAPLQSLPSITLPDNGEEVLMGRSSNSSNYQLSANRLISRVHVKARYIASSAILEPNKVEIKCEGWNGARLHCQGRTWELAKGDSFTSETEFAEIMLDVQDARVMILWPRKRSEFSSDDEWGTSDGELEQNKPRSVRGLGISSSPLRRAQPIGSPISPTPGGPRGSFSQNSIGNNPSGTVQIYEDKPDAVVEGEIQSASNIDVNASFMTQIDSEPLGLVAAMDNSQSSSDLSEPENDPDEENDPIISSFGPYGANLSSRMASFTAGGGPSGIDSPSPKQRRDQTSQARTRGRPAQRKASTSPEPRSRSRSTPEADPTPIVNHVINQLAFSRNASTPLSALLSNLPAELKGHKDDSESSRENKGLTKEELKRMLEGSKCVGEVKREGKDAAGKALESQFYYVAEGDRDEGRKKAVQGGLGRVGLRECRKSHKQYYWKKPKTP